MRGWSHVAFGMRCMLCLVLGCSATATHPESPEEDNESSRSGRRVVELPLAGPAADRDAEHSGLAWWGDTLILLPQYPDRFPQGEGEGSLFGLQRDQIREALDGPLERGETLEPRPVRLLFGGLLEQVPEYQGFEAVVFIENQAYFTIETGGDEGASGYIVRGRTSDDDGAVTLEPETLRRIPPQRLMNNLAYEAVVAVDDLLLAIHEANASWVNPDARARGFTRELERSDDLFIAALEHRVTDATSVDEAGRFWVMNYRWAGDRRLHPAGTPYNAIERIVELEIDAAQGRIRTSGRTPISLRATGNGRNWEGLARFGTEGVLLITDLHPRTVLAYVSFDRADSVP